MSDDELYPEEEEEEEEEEDPDDVFIPVVVTAATAKGVLAAAESPVSTVLVRLIRAGISPDRAHAFIAAGAIRVDGKQVTDPNAPAGPPSRIVLLPT
jgi:hypothetical protein